MSTAEIVRYIDERTKEERAFIQDYLQYLSRPRPKNLVKVDAATAAMLRQRSEDMEAGRNVVTQDEWDRRMADLDRKEH